MHPILVQFIIAGHVFKIYTYGVMAAMAILLGWSCAIISARKYRLDVQFTDKLIVYSVIAGLVGAHWLYLIQYPSEIKNLLWDLLWIIGHGRVWYGGFISGVLFALFYLKKKKKSVLVYFDLISPCVALAHCIGRIGCFFHGCCYGLPSERFGLYFKALGMKVIPTQLISSFGLLVIFLILLRIRQRVGVGTGWVISSYMVLYGVFRFMIEFIRGDLVPVWMGLRFSQWVSIGLVIAGVGLYLWKRER